MTEVRLPTYSTRIDSWTVGERRSASLVVLGGSLALLLLGALVFIMDLPEALLWILLVLLALLLGFEATLLLWGARRAEEEAGGLVVPHEGPAYPHPPWTPPAEEPKPATPEPVPEKPPEILTLRCGDCGTVFDVEDRGVRPLRHVCPGCGAEGVLEEEGAPPAEPLPSPLPPEPSSPPPPPTPEARPKPKRLKLRCPGCKEVFTIDDPGVRPFRHNCPNCGRLGELR